MVVAVAKPIAVGRSRTRFFVGVALTMLVVIALGFGRSFYARPLYVDRPLAAYLVVHGITMTAWYLLFLVQTVLVSAARTHLHRKLGYAGLALAAAVVATGVVVNLNLVPRQQALGGVRSPAELEFLLRFALDSISSLGAFAIVIGTAIAFRRRPGVHRRLMFWAFVWTLGPAFTDTRPLGQFLDPLVEPYLPFFPADFLWLGALVAFDLRTERRVHPATYLGFLVLAAYFVFVTPWVAGNDTLQHWLQAYAAAHPYPAR